MPASGLLISWATTAASFPSDAIFSTTSIWWCVFSSCRVFSCTRSSSVRFSPSSSSRARCRSPVMSFHERPSRPISSLLRTGTRTLRSPAPARSIAERSRLTGRSTSPHSSRYESPTTASAGGHEAVRELAFGGADHRVGPGHRQAHVEDTQHALRRRVDVAGRAGGLVVDRGDDAEDPLAVGRAQHADAVLTLEAGFRLRARVARDALVRALVDERPLLSRHRGHPDAAFLVVDADPGDALLGADVRDHAPNAFGVVAQHRVVRRAARHVGEPVGGERHQPLDLHALALEAELVRHPQDRRGPEPEPEAHANGETPPGVEAPRHGGGVHDRRMANSSRARGRGPGRASARPRPAAPAPRPATSPAGSARRARTPRSRSRPASA